MGIKFITCSRHAVSREPVQILLDDKYVSARIISRTDKDEKKPIFLASILDGSGRICEIFFDQERQGYISAASQRIENVEEVT
jgi:hypothetical protein